MSLWKMTAQVLWITEFEFVCQQKISHVTYSATATQEWNAPCRQLIIDNFQWWKQVTGRACAMPCVHGDLEGCIPPNTYSPTDAFMHKFWKVDCAPLFKSQFCYTHNTECIMFPDDRDLGLSETTCLYFFALLEWCRNRIWGDLENNGLEINLRAAFQGSDIETAGLPCWDMSYAGQRRQEDGRTVGAFLTHAKRHVELQTPIVIVENTKACFDRSYFHQKYLKNKFSIV